jgi:hypothetical protein
MCNILHRKNLKHQKKGGDQNAATCHISHWAHPRLYAPHTEPEHAKASAESYPQISQIIFLCNAPKSA